MSNAIRFGLSLMLIMLLILAIVSIQHRDTPNNIMSERLMNNTIHIQCEDEHEPVVTKLPNTTEIVVSCEAK